MTAIQARCFSLDTIQGREGKQIEALINRGFDYHECRWNKTKFIGGCVFLKSCAKSLLDVSSVARMEDRSER